MQRIQWRENRPLKLNLGIPAPLQLDGQESPSYLKFMSSKSFGPVPDVPVRPNRRRSVEGLLVETTIRKSSPTAMALFTRTSSLMSETNPDKLYDAACKLKEQGNLEGCVDALKAILTAHPDHLQTHLALGVHLQKLNRFDDAIKHAKRVTELNQTTA